MKRLTIFLGIAAILLVSGCNEPFDVDDKEAEEKIVEAFKIPVEGEVTEPQENDAYPYISLTKAQQGVSDKANAFGIEMFKDLVKENKTNKNVVFSPLSLSMALALTSSGAQGQTLAEMAKALGFEGLSSADIGSYYKQILSSMVSADKKTAISSANAVWTSYDLKQGFVDEVEALYDAKIENLDFSGSPDKAMKTINDWAKEKTNGLIPQFLKEPLAKDVVMLLTNALYFNGKWSCGPYSQTDSEFKGIAENKAVKTKFFLGQQQILSYFGADASVIKLPYGNGSFSMVFVLPAEGLDFKAFVSQLPADRWAQWMSHMTYHYVQFDIPEYKTSSRFDDMKSALMARGMVIPFTGAAEFGRMTSRQLFISNVFQEAVIEVSGIGTEAAAVTGVEMKDGCAGPDDNPEPISFIADRPFLYAVVENSHNTLLFLGQHVTADK